MFHKGPFLGLIDRIAKNSNMKYILTLLFLIVFLTSCQKPPVFNDGDVYSIKTMDKQYNIVKVLGSNRRNIYLCIYDEELTEPPKALNSDAYKVCDMDISKHYDKYFYPNGQYIQGSFKGTLIITMEKKSFAENHQPIFLFQFPVTDDEKTRITQYENQHPEEKDK